MAEAEIGLVADRIGEADGIFEYHEVATGHLEINARQRRIVVNIPYLQSKRVFSFRQALHPVLNHTLTLTADISDKIVV